ncbi:NmrA family protein [Sphingomonas sp. ABOLE]|uniref:NmrA family NAD(P)-binding protein n=1 Tax=Sphingomonas sp. ABOLE TaxID=1985878 RepID=UPI000F7F1BF3|nr:NmrA family NAD(P)-binding protein [Sphingomonas sp. ABOLE]RSV43200.1 NmrA family protein [Sphingomonas sp. ABOLE]
MIVVAGASGDLGGRIVQELYALDAPVIALARPGTSAASLHDKGFVVRECDFSDVDSIARALSGAQCVVSALSGLDPVIVGAQGRLLDAAVQAGAARFIPSDFAIDFRRVPPKSNRNLALRRMFLEKAQSAPIRLTSILNGAFMDMLTGTIPIIQHRIKSVLYWGSADQPMDFTTIADTARYTARAAIDPEAPRWLKIAGAQVSVRDIAAAVSRVRGSTYRVLPAGTLGSLGLIIQIARRIAPGRPDDLYPAWQGMQYMRNLFAGEGAFEPPLDNDRYRDMTWTSLDEVLRAARAA